MEFKPVSLLRGFFKTFSVLILVGLGAVVLGAGYFFYNLTQGLPDVSTLKQIRLSSATEVFSDEGRKIGEFSTEHRYPVRFEVIPKHVTNAFIAAEDAKFYEHHGIDLTGITRAFFSNILRGRFAQGASTITQQVARGLLLATRKKEITRKIREMILAVRMEHQLTKAEILNLYLSDIYLGHGAWGIGAAAENYFHKKVENLTVAEAALLAGLPQRPNEWDPFHNPYLAKKRQQYVLKQMVENGFIKLDEARAALREPLRLYKLEDLNNTAAPFYTEYVRSYLMSKYGTEKVLSQGMKVYTSLRYDFQKDAERAVDRGLRTVDKRLGWRGVAGHIDEPAKVQAFLEGVHDEVMDKADPVRLLPYDINSKARKLPYDLTTFQAQDSPYFGPTPVKVGEVYNAYITRVDETSNSAYGRIGQTDFSLPISGMEWVKEKNLPVKRVSHVLKAGDVVEVRADKIENRMVVASLEQEPEIQGSLLSFDVQSGMVRAMVGGSDFNRNKFNCALQAKRQVGSTFKPIIYAAAIDKGYSPSSIVTDSPIVFKVDGAPQGTPMDGSGDEDSVGMPWRPHNFEGRFEGELPLRTALIHSMNVPTVKLLDQIGVDYGIQYARRMGITATLPRDLTIGLGSVSMSLDELLKAYAIFPRLGRPVNLVFIRKVVDANGNVLEEASMGTGPATPVASGTEAELNAGRAYALPHAPPSAPEVTAISPQTAYVITDMLKGVVREGTGIAASAVPAPVAGKTGTSSNHRDTWFVGFTPYVITGVWIGYEKDKPLDPAETGGRAAAPVFTDYMTQVVPNYPHNDFTIPDDITFAYVDKHTGRLATASTAKRVRVAFRVGTVPNQDGSNLLRVGEPGAERATSNAVMPGVAGVTKLPGQSPTSVPVPPRAQQKADETSDFMREGYQD